MKVDSGRRGLRRSCAVLGDSRDPTVAARFLDLVVDMPVVFNDRCWVLFILGWALCTDTGPGFTPF